MEALSNLTEVLANLTLKWVLMAVGVLMVALTALRLPAQSRDRTADWLVENIQVVLSVVVVVFLIIRPFLFQAFYIPSGSMEPTLMGPARNETTGDRLLVNKLIYRITDPTRGDIVVFRAPREASPDEKEYIKRVIGLPGERIESVPPRIVVDGRAVVSLTTQGPNNSSIPGIWTPEDTRPQVSDGGKRVLVGSGPAGEAGTPDLKVLAAPRPEVRYDPYRVEVDGKVELQDDAGTIRIEQDLALYGGDPQVRGTIYSINGVPRLILVEGETLRYDPGHIEINGKRLIETYLAAVPWYGMPPRNLGPKQYFMMGDNRNNSNDSRNWGPLDRERVIGRAEILFWPLSRFTVIHWWLLTVIAGLLLGYNLLQRVLSPRG